MKRFAKLILIVAAVAVVGTAGCSFIANEAAPEVRYTTLGGQSIATADLRGKVVLVNFWATSCEVKSTEFSPDITAPLTGGRGR